VIVRPEHGKYLLAARAFVNLQAEVMGTMAVSIVVDGINAVQEKRGVSAVHRKVAPELAIRHSTRSLL
jgi:hypothetical protein